MFHPSVWDSIWVCVKPWQWFDVIWYFNHLPISKLFSYGSAEVCQQLLCFCLSAETEASVGQVFCSPQPYLCCHAAVSMVPVISIEWPAFVCSACMADYPSLDMLLIYEVVVWRGDVAQGETLGCMFPSQRLQTEMCGWMNQSYSPVLHLISLWISDHFLSDPVSSVLCALQYVWETGTAYLVCEMLEFTMM